MKNELKLYPVGKIVTKHIGTSNSKHNDKPTSTLTKRNHSRSLGVEELKGSLVEGIRHTQEALEGVELRERYEAILARVQDTAEELDGLGVGVRLRVQAEVASHKVISCHEQLAILVHCGVLWARQRAGEGKGEKRMDEREEMHYISVRLRHHRGKGVNTFIAG
ncbi:hypothetical protein E2C01_010120 [Portunus trituberculatus]|uniref:Uncharacterized protein n=1 Tax=Portunus trituberculatus TaxID=210409 RepID=A0A5B7D7J1_PORTR|nr:hypothetical protein [Portunus trituberculatus]